MQWALAAARVEAAWDRTTGSASTVVAVIDTGILAAHPDLAGRILAGRDFISNAANAGDGDAYDADPTDVGTDSATSSGFHGTHVAGIIGAATNNAKGVAGVNWACKILPVRALGVDAGKGEDADIAAAIRWAAGLDVPGVPKNPTPAKVINLSFGGPGETQVLTSAVVDAQKAGAIVVAAAGNHSSDTSNIFPAAAPGVIAVAATKWSGQRAPYSNYGPRVTLMAPGGLLAETLPYQVDGKSWPAGILSTLYVSKDKSWAYILLEGTSQAAPLVSGVASLMLAVNPKLDAQQAATILKASADAKGKCSEGCGAGMVNAAAAVQQAGGGSAPPPSTPPPGSKLGFNSPCQSDEQCSDGVCRDLFSGTKVCTRFCTLASSCPASSSCTNGLCKPAAAPASSSPGQQPIAKDAGGVTVEGVGCAVAPVRGVDLGWLLLSLVAPLRARRGFAASLRALSGLLLGLARRVVANDPRAD
jgi:serine protease